MMLSLAMACNRRGAPVRLCRPAPQVEKKEPMTMTQGEGQANVPTTRFLLTPSPYLQGARLRPYTIQGAPKPWVRDIRSVRMAMVGRALASQHRSSIHQPLSVLLVPALILMSPFSKKQK